METKTICCFLVTPGAQPGVKCRQGSLGVFLLTCYAGPTVGAGVGFVLHVCGVVCVCVCVLSRPRFHAGFCLVR